MYDKLIKLKLVLGGLICLEHLTSSWEEMGTKIRNNTEYFVLRYSSINPQGRTAQIREWGS